MVMPTIPSRSPVATVKAATYDVELSDVTTADRPAKVTDGTVMGSEECTLRVMVSPGLAKYWANALLDSMVVGATIVGRSVSNVASHVTNIQHYVYNFQTRSRHHK